MGSETIILYLNKHNWLREKIENKKNLIKNDQFNYDNNYINNFISNVMNIIFNTVEKIKSVNNLIENSNQYLINRLSYKNPSLQNKNRINHALLLRVIYSVFVL